MPAPEEERTFSFSVVHLPLGLPFEITVRIPFTRNRVIFGKNSLALLRRRAALSPDDQNAQITFAAHLLSEEPVSPAHAAEAVKHLTLALGLMPPDEESEVNAQQKAMIHAFLGDAWIVLDQREEAHRHWNLAIALDPVAPPNGFSGWAQGMIGKYPLH